MINKEIILNADGSIKKDFSDRAIPQNSNNQVSVNVLIPSTCFTGLSNYAVLLAVSRIIGNSETTLNTLVMSVSKSITIDGVLYVKYTAYLSSDYTDKLGQLKFSPYIQTTTTTTIDDESVEVISIQQAFTNSNLNVIKSVLPQYDASMEEATIATTLAGQIALKKIYTFIDNDSASLGQHYYELATGYDPSATQFEGCLVVSVYDDETRQYMPYLNDGEVELLEITKDGKFYLISGVDYSDSTYTYTRLQISYSKNEIDSQVSDLQTQINGKVDKTQKVNGHALSGDITISKGDVGLGNVANMSYESTPTASGESLYITSKGVYDALQDLNSAITLALSGKADTTDITSLDSRLDAIEALIGDNDGDQDNIINTLKEVIQTLSGLGEDANILNLINAKCSQSDFNTLDGEINGVGGIKEKVDLLSEQTNAYMEIKNSLGTIDIAVSDWDDNDDANYPYKWELTNGYLENAVNCIVVYSKDSDTSMLSATTGIDEENGKLIIYASELPSDTISIEKIAVFNDLNSYINYSNEIVQQVMQNTGAINDIDNVKLPLYVKIEQSHTKNSMTYESNFERNNTTTNNVGYLAMKGKMTHTSGTTQESVVRASNSNAYLKHTYTPDANNSVESTCKVDSDGLTIEVKNKVSGATTTHNLTFDENGDLKIDGNAVGGGGHKVLRVYSSAINEVPDEFKWYVSSSDINDNVIDLATGSVPTSYEQGDIVIAVSYDIQTDTDYIDGVYVVNVSGLWGSAGDLLLELQMLAKSGGKQLYQHNIWIYQNDNNSQMHLRLSFSIINESNEELDTKEKIVSEVVRLIGQNSYASTSNGIITASGQATTSAYQIVGITTGKNSDVNNLYAVYLYGQFYVNYTNLVMSWNATIKDKIIAL